MTEERMNPLERYHSYRKYLMLPTFDTGKEAEQAMPVEPGEFRCFILRGPPTSYIVCRAYISQARGQDPKWTYDEEFSFLHADIQHAKQQATSLVGMKFSECVV